LEPSPSNDDNPEAHEDDQVDLFDNESFARAASGIDRIEAFLIQRRGAVKTPARFTAKQFLTGRSNLSPTPVLTELGETATAISGPPPQNCHPTEKALLIIVNTYTKREYQLGAGPVTIRLWFHKST
jgi:hypothetical protein